jgi:PAS domain S-box-containing protein
MIIGIFIIVIYLHRQSLFNVEQMNETLITTSLQEEWEKKIRALTILMAKEFVQPMHELNVDEMYYLADIAMKDEGIIYVFVQDEMGRVLVDTTDKSIMLGEVLTDEFTKKALDAKRMVIQRRASIIDIAAPILIGTTRMGFVRIGFSTEGIQKTTAVTTKKVRDSIDQAINATKKNILLLLLAILVFAVAVGWFFMTRLFSPIKNLMLGTEMIAKGNLAYRIETESRDEIGQLAVSFNKMTKDLQETTVSKEYVDSIITNMADTLIVVSPEETIQNVNKATCDLLGYKEDELIGKPVEMVFKDESSNELSFNKLIKQDSANNAEKTYLSKDGRKILMLFSASAMHDVDGNIQGIICVAHDITKLKLAEEKLVKMQKLESVGVLAGGIAHDFNNILQGILGSIAIAKLYVNPEDEVYKRLTDAEKTTIQSKGLSQQLLTFSKGGNPIRQTVFITKLIKDSVNLALSGSNVRCEFNIPDNLWSVEADKGQLKQVISNLIINADQAMPEGGIVKVKSENINVDKNDLMLLKKGKYVRITVEDQGTGIPQEHLNKIFDPYFTTKEKGSGLGLSICYSITKKHDGYIAVDSDTGVGTTFYVYLPASQKDVSVEPEQREVREVATKEVSLRDKGKILIMDDEAIISHVAARYLKSLKYEVETVKDGAEAIVLYKGAMESGEPFDAVIMDLTIPGGMGGKETIKELIKIDPEVRAIVSSGYNEDPVISHYREYGFSGVLAKPYGIDEMSKVLHAVLLK